MHQTENKINYLEKKLMQMVLKMRKEFVNNKLILKT